MGQLKCDHIYVRITLTSDYRKQLEVTHCKEFIVIKVFLS